MSATEETRINSSINQTFADACALSCQRLITQIKRAKDALLAEFRGSFGVSERLLQLALNEAEALAWGTEFPHLVFPLLATEKAEAVAAWEARQRSVRRTGSARALAT
jgi:hypothetical protein